MYLVLCHVSGKTDLVTPINSVLFCSGYGEFGPFTIRPSGIFGEFGPFTIRPSGIFGEFGLLVGEFGPQLENSAK